MARCSELIHIVIFARQKKEGNNKEQRNLNDESIGINSSSRRA